MDIEGATEIRQIPAIIKGSKVQIVSPEMAKLDYTQLRDMAVTLGGILAYIKVRVTYSELETPLCTARDCYRPVGQDEIKCKDHKR